MVRLSRRRFGKGVYAYFVHGTEIANARQMEQIFLVSLLLKEPRLVIVDSLKEVTQLVHDDVLLMSRYLPE